MKNFQNPRSAAAPNYPRRTSRQDTTARNSIAPEVKGVILIAIPLLEFDAND
jgi:hypothetical protein